MKTLLAACALLALGACSQPQSQSPESAPEPAHAAADAPGAAARPAREGAVVTAGALALSNFWVRETPDGAQTGAGFVTIENRGDAPDALISVASPRAGRIELHETVSENGMMQMRRRASILIPAHGKAELEPGGMHIMFFDMATPFKAGEETPVTLTFEKQGAVVVALPVEAGAKSAMDMH